ncbi:Alpha-ketoglutarate-dependent dioxygenase alkB 6 [Phlyctochytrium planicorne]|nr:Alpha-ketoglutarate-dependent dioxygenase alkB 6 [Phlyctochytrium planicorne]
MLAFNNSLEERYRLKKAPPKVLYIRDYITEEEERSLLRNVYQAPLPKWVSNWGCTPVGTKGIALPESLPSWINSYAKKLSELGCFDIVDVADSENHVPSGTTKRIIPNHVLINEYHPGQGIMPHVDGPAYFPAVATISLGGHTVLDLYHQPENPNPTSVVENALHEQTRQPTCSILLEPRSLVVIQDDVYTHHLHGIADRTEDVVDQTTFANCDENATMARTEPRVSLTFRSARRVSKLDLMGLVTGKNVGGK